MLVLILVSGRRSIEEPTGWGLDCCSQNEVITLEETVVTQDMSSQAQENSLVLSSRSALKGGTQQPTNHHCLSGREPCGYTASSEEEHITLKKWTWPLLWWWVVETGKNNRCQSSLHVICHLSKFQIIPQLRRKMKARMFSRFDILINYFLQMKN